ncbi:MAG: hypothetical protein AAF628_11205 [Planctomycetota bacterium]
MPASRLDNVLGFAVTLALGPLAIASETSAQATWTERAAPAAREQSAAVWDAARQRLVLFGGQTWEPDCICCVTYYRPKSDTWESRDGIWVQRQAGPGPSARSGHAMAYDEARRCVVLFGGGGSYLSSLRDTWEWDGRRWRRASPSQRPTVGPMAYDGVSQRVLLVTRGAGGAETWHWSGVDWARVATGAGPTGGALAFDAARQVVVAVEGANTWEWDGAAWTQRSPATRPGARFGLQLAYDAARARVVMFGGSRSGEYPDDTWEWDGVDWQRQAAVAGGPAGRENHTLAYDAVRQRVVLIGGYASTARFAFLADSWAWDGAVWTPIRASSARDAVYDAARQRLVMRTRNGETWEWDAHVWERKRPQESPARAGWLAYDAARQVTLYHGGGETWEWDGVDWRRRTPAQSPLIGRMAYDAARQRVVLVNGAAQTWEWDGSEWSDRTPAVAPPGGGRLVYDAARQRIVYYAQSVRTETWEWDGTTWTLRSLTGPVAVLSSGLAYDATRQRVVFYGAGGYGGGFCSSPSHGNGTWEWDGSFWQSTSPATRPPSVEVDALAYHGGLQRLLLLATDDEGEFVTWVYGDDQPAAMQARGRGCEGAMAVPLLSGFDAPRLGSRAFAFDVTGAAPSTPATVLVSGRFTTLPLPGGCELLVDPTVLLPTPVQLTTAQGFASQPVPIPMLPALIGAELHAQGAVADPGITFGAALSAALDVQIGV